MKPLITILLAFMAIAGKEQVKATPHDLINNVQYRFDSNGKGYYVDLDSLKLKIDTIYYIIDIDIKGHGSHSTFGYRIDSAGYCKFPWNGDTIKLMLRICKTPITN